MHYSAAKIITDQTAHTGRFQCVKALENSMGLFAFKRAREKEAAATVVSKPSIKKKKPKTNGTNITHNDRKQHSK